MKVAIVHDTLLELGGAERVLFSLVKLFPQADIYLSLANKKLVQELKNKTQGQITTSFLSKLPWKKSYASWLKPLILIYWRMLNLNQYQLVISSSHSFNSKTVRTHSQAKHISYIYTPPRFLYGQFNKTGLITRSKISFLFKPLIQLMKKIDYRLSQEPDRLIAISKVVKNRIKSYYDRDSVVIYPPLRPIKPYPKKTPQYYVCWSRLYQQKGVDLAIKTCNQLKRKLLVIGAGPEEHNLKKIAGPTIKFAGFLSDQEISMRLQKAKALIYPSIEEDFGLCPIESMAHGVPVIAHNSGATPEYVTADNGIMFDHYSIKALKNAILKFERQTWSEQKCKKFASQFNEQRFHRQILEQIKITDNQ